MSAMPESIATSDAAEAVAVAIGRRLNPQQSMTSEIITWGYAQHPVVSILLTLLGGETASRLLDEHQRFQTDLRTLATAAESLSSRGWTLSRFTPLAPCHEVLDMKTAGASDEEIDAVLIAVWNDSGLFDTLAHRVTGLGAADDELRAISAQRGRLVALAVKLHKSREYAASIPLLLAQVEGICMDATATDSRPKGLGFFSKASGSDSVIDDATVAGMECGLAAVRAYFSSEVPTSGAHGAGSRHGVMHGRDLAYDTPAMSTKCLVLLLAVWEWANGQLSAQALERQKRRYALHAGDDGCDERGWRLDRRGFVGARDALLQIAHAQSERYTRTGRYGGAADLLVPIASGSPPGGKPIVQALFGMTATESCWYAVLPTEARWIFAVGGRGGTTYFWDGHEAPSAAPPGGSWRAEQAGNWSGDCYW